MRYKIALFVLLCCSLFGVEKVNLKAPDLSRENIIGIILGDVYERGAENALIMPETIDKIIESAERCLLGEF